MAKLFKWFFLSMALLGLVGVAAAVSLHYWLGSGDFRSRLEAESSEVLGVPVTLARVHLSFWPQPAVALDGVQVRTTPTLSMARVELRPEWRALLAGRREVAALVVREAQWPQRGIDQLLAARQKARAVPAKETTSSATDDAEPDLGVDWVLRHIVLERVTWRDARDAATTFDADARLAGDSLPQTLDLQVREGPWKDAKVNLLREGPRWAVDAQLGGGTVRGHLQYAATAPAARARTLSGELVTRGVEITSLAASASGQRGPLSGQLEATTTLTARAPNAAGLLPALQTQSRFTVRNAELHGLDLAKAVTTVGLSRGGETRLDTLTGQLDTQGRGTARLHELVASSGVLRATGEVALAPSRALSGRVLVDLTAGAAGRLVGVPLTVGGTLDAPEVTLSRGAMLGAAIGTVVMPGVGTGAGAQMGDRLSQGVKKLFEK